MFKKDQQNEKREGRKIQRESGSQTDNDSVPHDGHCCKAVAELWADMSKMNAKLAQLLGLFKEVEDIKVQVNDLEKENKKLTEAADSTEEEIAGLKSMVANACLNLNDNMQNVVSLQKDILQLKRRNIKLEGLHEKREH